MNIIFKNHCQGVKEPAGIRPQGGLARFDVSPTRVEIRLGLRDRAARQLLWLEAERLHFSDQANELTSPSSVVRSGNEAGWRSSRAGGGVVKGGSYELRVAVRTLKRSAA